jgi:hypothetical protein
MYSFVFVARFIRRGLDADQEGIEIAVKANNGKHKLLERELQVPK